MYKKPIWITEMGEADWDAESVSDNKYSQREVSRYPSDAFRMLDRIKYVQRYARFTFRHDHLYGTCSALWGKDGELTKVGEAFAEH